jgi:hypothetical protein
MGMRSSHTCAELFLYFLAISKSCGSSNKIGSSGVALEHKENIDTHIILHKHVLAYLHDRSCIQTIVLQHTTVGQGSQTGWMQWPQCLSLGKTWPTSPDWGKGEPPPDTKSFSTSTNYSNHKLAERMVWSDHSEWRHRSGDCWNWRVQWPWPSHRPLLSLKPMVQVHHIVSLISVKVYLPCFKVRCVGISVVAVAILREYIVVTVMLPKETECLTTAIVEV